MVVWVGRRRWLAGLAVAPLLAGAVVAIAVRGTPADASTAPKTQVHTLPSGDRVQVGAGGTPLCAAPGKSGAAVTSTVAGRVTVVPVEAMRGLTSADAYQVAGPKPGGLTKRYTMAALRVTARNHDGGPP